MGSFKKYVTCVMAFFTTFNFVRLCQLYSITSPVLFTKLNLTKKLYNERKEVFGIYGCINVNRY